MMEIITLKSNARKAFTRKDFNIVQRLTGALSRVSFLTDFFINMIVFYIFILLYGISAILFFKFTVKPRKSIRRHA